MKFYSSEMAQEEIEDRLEELEELKNLLQMKENHEYSDDADINDKLYELYMQEFMEQHIRDDQRDLQQVDTIEILPAKP